MTIVSNDANFCNAAKKYWTVMEDDGFGLNIIKQKKIWRHLNYPTLKLRPILPFLQRLRLFVRERGIIRKFRHQEKNCHARRFHQHQQNRGEWACQNINTCLSSSCCFVLILFRRILEMGDLIMANVEAWQKSRWWSWTRGGSRWSWWSTRRK
jgi:hypothetical protein